MGPQHLWVFTVLLISAALPAFASPLDASTADLETRAIGRSKLWKPAVGTPFQIILSQTIKIPKGGVKDLKPNVPVWDSDLFDNPKETFTALRNAGKTVICYFSAGTYENWRDDKSSFQKKDLGNPLSGWPGERWVNIRSSSVRSIMAKRIKLAAEKGCDAIDPDNMDGYSNDNGLGLTEADTISYVKFLSSEAAKYKMVMGMKNGGSITESVLPYVGFCINESCIQYAECDLYSPYIDAEKPVFNIEYPKGAPTVKAVDRNRICSVKGDAQGSDGFSKVMKKMNLDEWVMYCP
ncbi:endo alpha-14 polygalactosaminidase precursor [Fusarium albosuccineum]|uniref:alpha-galactosidase n=1 Tax=Fusarium albosuccineum TaxID=1237068 RepID=A0A8H4PK09_9HYPO|nr:endo alpha-14 polygalactosaminidase precursor [Fusarium albosuccineum]